MFFSADGVGMSLEQVVICHCGPVLTGIKVANLISCSLKDFPDLENDIAALKNRCASFGLECRIICRYSGFFLVFVYNRCELETVFKDTDVFEYMERLGYKMDGVESLIDQLSLCLKIRKTFPHEIGVFLGYPLEDVEGFVENCGKNFKISGYWKVYGDMERAMAVFKQYDCCRKKCLMMAVKGFCIEDVIRSADLKFA